MYAMPASEKRISGPRATVFGLAVALALIFVLFPVFPGEMQFPALHPGPDGVQHGFQFVGFHAATP